MAEDLERLAALQEELAAQKRAQQAAMDNGMTKEAPNDVSVMREREAAEAAIERTFDEKLAILDKTVTRHPLNRECLYKILKFGADEHLLRDIENEIATWPEFQRATQNQFFMIDSLVKAYGMEFIERAEDGHRVTPEEKEGLSEDEIDDLVATWHYRTTDVGLAYVEAHAPAARLIELLNLSPERRSTYVAVLEYVGESPRSMKDIEAFLADKPPLYTVIDGAQTQLKPSVFVDKLERAGALVWNKGWNLTEEGIAYLADMKA